MAASKINLKLLIDTQNNKVLFAEAGKDFVDFLFYLLSLPVGTVVKLLGKNRIGGSLGKLYEGIENLSETYIQPNKKKSVLNPRSPICNTKTPLLQSDYNLQTAKLYTCPGSRVCTSRRTNRGMIRECKHDHHTYVTDVKNSSCPTCNLSMCKEMYYVSPEMEITADAAGEGGFVKGVVDYMVMDDLEVMPMSTISSIALLNKFNVKDVGALEERVVEFGMDEGVKLLKASLECKNVLTSVFNGNKDRK